MTDAAQDLSRYPDITHLVLLRVYDETETLIATLPHTQAGDAALRILHGVLDRDGRIGSDQATQGLQALGNAGEGAADVKALLERIRGTAPHRVAAVTSPVPDLLARIAARAGDKGDTEAFVALLNSGDVRAAEKVDGAWQPQPYVIDGILNFFAVQPNRRFDGGWWDKVPLKTVNHTDAEFEAGGVRFAPGCQVRTGAYVGPGTVVMNQAFINIGAHIAGHGVMIDGGARVASCAQIGKGVKFGAGSGIEGILEPAGRMPSIIEDNVKIGAMCEVAGIVGEGAVVASGVVMASGKKIYDEATGEIVPSGTLKVGQTVYQIPVIPPHRLAVGGSLIATNGKFATDAIILKPGDLRDTDTLKSFEKQGILYQ